MAEETVSQAIAEMSFEAALEELETIVRQLEEGKSAHDDAISAYERGAAVKKHCEAKLREAQMKFDKIVLGDDGKVSVEPAGIDG